MTGSKKQSLAPYIAMFLAGSLFSVIAIPISRTIAEPVNVSYRDLIEAQGHIRQCRQVILETSAEVFDNTQLGEKPDNRLTTLPGGTYVGLTGVFRDVNGGTAVQIFAADAKYFIPFQPVGWVDASKLTQCKWVQESKD